MIKLGVKIKSLITIISIAIATLVFSFAGIMVINFFNRPKDQTTMNDMQVEAWSGSGTESSPYLITSISDMNTLSTNVANGNGYANTYFKLTNDLDYSGVANFTPIGSTVSYDSSTKEYKYTESYPFCGIFDGNGRIVSNLKTQVDTWSRTGNTIGFFSSLGRPIIPDLKYIPNKSTATAEIYATVKNLKIKNFKVSANCGQLDIGGIAGTAIIDEGRYSVHRPIGASGSNSETTYEYFYEVVIDNCIVEGFEIEGKTLASNNKPLLNVSGLVGYEWLIKRDGYVVGDCELIISNCMVLDFNVVNYHNLSIITSIGPSNATYGDDSSTILAYFYDISCCVTDSTFYTINGEGVYDSSWDGEEFIHNPKPSSKYVYSGEEKGKHIYYNPDFACEIENSDNKLNKNVKWYVDEYSCFVYLQTFLVELNVSSNEEKYGTIEVNGWPLDEWNEYYNNPVIPRTDEATISSNKITAFEYKYPYDFEEDSIASGYYHMIEVASANAYEFEAITNTGYKFVRWEVSVGTNSLSYTAIFEEPKEEIKIKFLARSGTNRTANAEYTVIKGSTMKISLQSTLSKQGTYTTVKFEFKDKSDKSCTISYIVQDKTKYIASHSRGTVTSVKLDKAGEEFYVNLETKKYNSTFS